MSRSGWLAVAGFAAVVTVVLLGAERVAAQEGNQTPPPPVNDTVQLVFEREVFRYPATVRRNPFRPLSAGDVGPSFEQLVLLGTIVTDNPSEAVALIGLRGGGNGGSAAAGASHRLRVGETLGNTRIREIRHRMIVVDVEAFGLAERRILEVQRTEPRADGEPGDESAPPAQGDTLTSPPDTVPPPGGTGGGIAAAGEAGSGAADVVPNGNGGT